MQAFQSSAFLHVEVFTNLSMKRVKIILFIMLATCLFMACSSDDDSETHRPSL